MPLVYLYNIVFLSAILPVPFSNQPRTISPRPSSYVYAYNSVMSYHIVGDVMDSSGYHWCDCCSNTDASGAMAC